MLSIIRLLGIYVMSCVPLAVMGLNGTATLTYYISYAPCCEENSNYDPDADTTECDLYSACDYPGLFAALDDQKSYEWVASHNLVAFFDSADASNTLFHANYARKNITLVKDDDIVFSAWIVDVCGDSDCGGCCTANAGANGYVVDLEYYTALRMLGDISLATGTVDFYIDEPYLSPSARPSGEPSTPPSGKPTANPTAPPSSPPTELSSPPSSQPTEGSHQPTSQPTAECSEGRHGFTIGATW